MEQHRDIQLLSEKVVSQSTFLDKLYHETSKIIVGQQHMLDRLVLALLSNGHILLEGMPGLAKTLSIRTLSSAIQASFQRIQFTPDLLPSDIVGTMIYNPAKSEFSLRKGPVFANFILADEINRAPAKVQSAMLEAMQERQITLGSETLPLPDPFLVLATQNPIEQEGTYPLPEAQVDRFIFKVVVKYPERREELEIMRRHMSGQIQNAVEPVVNTNDIIQARALISEIYIDEKIENYILDIVFATRNPSKFGMADLEPMLAYGSSPRGSINIATAARAKAFVQKRAFVIPDDIKDICHDVLRHRIGLSYEGEAEGLTTDHVIDSILQKIYVP